VSKSSRRSPRTGTNAGSRPTGASTGAASGGSSGPTRPVRPGPTTRHGRRERPRYGYADRSFLQRHRGTVLTVAGMAAAVLVAGFIFLGSTAPSYACTVIWEPEPTASPNPGESPRLGYVQPNMGNSHIVQRPQRYTTCPPATGTHFGDRPAGPIDPGLYGPDDGALPMGWVHNLEHGALVVLYRGEGETVQPATLQQMQAFFDAFPNSPVCDIPRGQVGPVIARFDDMAWPYAALLWGRVLPLESFDTAQILEFFRTEADKAAPELPPACLQPSPSAAPSDGASPSAAPAGSAAPSGSGEASASPAASASGAASPSASPSASPG
jgi:uncharacterized protein DUF3105